MVWGSDVELVPESGVVVENGRARATSREPWLRFRSNSAFVATRFVELTYRSSLYDDPVRPVLRFLTADGAVDRILPGPVAGAAVWRGPVPRATHAVLVSPCARAGRFDFRIESVKPLGVADMVALVWRRKRGKLWSVLLPLAFGYRAEAENAMNWAIGSEPLDHFPAWHLLRERQIDLANLDAPRSDWSEGPSFLISIDAGGAPPDALSRTIRSLQTQVYPNFRAAILGLDPRTAPSGARGALVEQNEHARISFASGDKGPQELLAGADFVAGLRPGDELAPHALAVFAEEAARNPHVQFLYADELIGRDDRLRPDFKPNWSPLFESQRPYLGRCAFLRATPLASSLTRLDEGTLRRAMRGAALGLAPGEVVHLRRWLMSRSEEEDEVPALEQDVRAVPAQLREPPSVSVILLTRDRADLLGPCLDSVLRGSTHPRFELLIVDNGTRRADARTLLKGAAADPRVRVLARPGPFDFAGLNNEAVRASSGEILVFLNNDTEVLTKDWLERLSERALAPAAGAVGALLLFPNGRIQHAGVVVGLGQDAGHFEALAPETAPSWLGRTRRLHETSAVTAACMAVERRKFEAVGGFDALNLPIEFNDIDLCLRLAERGWPACYTPTVRVIHKESATRGNALLRPLSVYAREREYLRGRWRAVIRDDPYFHPGLSLYSRQRALG